MQQLERPVSQLLPYQSRYPCIICTERVKTPVSCFRCHSLLCLSHVRRIDDRCPYCRLSPFAFERDHFTDSLVELDRKKEEDWLIAHKQFQCLVEGCDFSGKYHKMDLHRRRFHRELTLREVIFEEAMESGKRLRAVQMLVGRIKERREQQERAEKLTLILHNRTRGRVGIERLMEMITHVDLCGHPHCQKVHAEAIMCFIGTTAKEMSSCVQAQRFTTYYQVVR